MNTNKPLRIVARSSELSLIQVKEVMSQLPRLNYTLLKVDSYGDSYKEISLIDNSMIDIFTRELDDMVLQGDADVAIHSAKDLPYPLRSGLSVAALTASIDKSDSLVSKENLKLLELSKGAKIGTSSPERKEQLLKLRPDLEIVSIRGTISERLQLIEKGQVDAIVVATCALERLGLLSKVAERLPFSTHPLQGNLAVTVTSDKPEISELFNSIDIRKQLGKVVIAGFGPGDPGLLTVKAKDALENADIIFHDDLVDRFYLSQFNADKVYVGKRFELHSHSQGEINQLLYDAALIGQKVVRLKGGDPFIFGRGGEEFDFLRERLIDVEVIPGVSTALGASAYSGIPLTHRTSSASVAFCTGYPVDRIQFPNTDTIVYYMGSKNIELIANGLVQRGRKPETPVALIKNATLPSQDIMFTTLADIIEFPGDYGSPLLVIVGDVVKDKNYHRFSPIRKKVMVTGTDASKYWNLGEVIHTPLIEIAPIEQVENFNDAITQSFDYVVFTSMYTARFFFRRLYEQGYDARWFINKKVVSIGKTTSAELRQFGIKADLQPSNESSQGIVELFRSYNITNKRVLLPRSDKALGIIPEGLTALGNQLETLVIYSNRLPKHIEKLDIDKIDIVVFTSPSTVQNFVQVYGYIPSHVELVTRGEQTESELNKYLKDKGKKNLMLEFNI